MSMSGPQRSHRHTLLVAEGGRICNGHLPFSPAIVVGAFLIGRPFIRLFADACPPKT